MDTLSLYIMLTCNWDDPFLKDFVDKGFKKYAED